ncbi:MAG TPA: adenosine deaminase, partial [Brachybacterium faecium]|nr:adenosine deaminase [Brachybacterium faecium]
MDLTASLVGALPKVALHDHLDGGLRAETVLELSQELGLEVPGLEAPLDEAPDAEDASGGTPPGDVTADAPATDAPSPEAPADAPPADPARAVADWFHSAADSGSLPAYLSTFERTVAVMQTAPQLRRVARE